MSEERYAESEALEDDIVGLRRRVLGPDHPDTLASLYPRSVSITSTLRFLE